MFIQESGLNPCILDPKLLTRTFLTSTPTHPASATQPCAVNTVSELELRKSALRDSQPPKRSLNASKCQNSPPGLPAPRPWLHNHQVFRPGTQNWSPAELRIGSATDSISVTWCGFRRPLKWILSSLWRQHGNFRPPIPRSRHRHVVRVTTNSMQPNKTLKKT